MQHNFYVLRRIVFNLFDFDLSLVIGLDDRINEARRRGTKG